MISGTLAAQGLVLPRNTCDEEKCDCCGQKDRLEPFNMEAILWGKQVVHRARLCSGCMMKAVQIVSLFLEKRNVQ